PSEYLYSMTMFFPSSYPSSRNPCQNPSTRFAKAEAEKGLRNPIRGTFFSCCASAITPTASCTTTTRIDGTAAFFIAHLISSVMYHADRDKGKCDLHGGRRQLLVEWETNFWPKIELSGATVKTREIGWRKKSIQSGSATCCSAIT